MPEQQQTVHRRKRRRRRRRRINPLFIVFVSVLLALVIGVFFLLRSLFAGKPEPSEPPKEKTSFFDTLFGKKEEEPLEETEPPTEPEPVHRIASATIAATGDILMHKPVFDAGMLGDGTYNFDFIFRYLKPFVDEADFSAANLETTLAGTDNGFPYSGYPNFNCPDEIVDGARNAGFDLLLTANNHCYDTGHVGFLRTVQTVKNKGLMNLGTTATDTEPKYIIQNINGIQVGMLCYTYEGPPADAQAGKIYLNNTPLTDGDERRVNSFLPASPEPFYEEIKEHLSEMRAKGAEAIVLFIHWGTEYETVPNATQRDIAQRLADLDIDMIVGGHPHVVQQLDMLTSRQTSNHKTLVLYSMGNAVSNQRKSEMKLNTGHTEDGVLLSFTFDKYSDGTVYLDEVNILPTWVDLRASGITKEYDIIPLTADNKAEWKTLYGLTDSAYDQALSSLERTEAIVGGGLSRAQNFLSARKEQREADYLAAFQENEAA